MKKFGSYIIALMMACGVCSLTSCSGEEDELIDDVQISDYSKGIVGLWKCQETRYWWRFNEYGSGVSYGEGDRWKPTEIEEEGDLGTDYFRWSFENLGLIIELRQEDANGGYFYRVNTESPYKVESMTAKAMILVSSDGETQHYERVN